MGQPLKYITSTITTEGFNYLRSVHCHEPRYSKPLNSLNLSDAVNQQVVGDDKFSNCFLAFAADWALWTLQGSCYIRNRASKRLSFSAIAIEILESQFMFIYVYLNPN